MKLFLCGGGSGPKLKQTMELFANSIDKNKPILYIPLAMEKNKYHDCYNWFKEEINDVNITNFEMVTSSKELSQKDLNNYSALFIGGGNTYKLLYELKQNNNYQKIEKFLANNGIAFGGSAGAIIFGKDINSCLNDDENYVNLKETNGFNMVSGFSILCHLKEKGMKKNLKYLQEFSKRNKTIYIPEEAVIYIDNFEQKILTPTEYLIFENGEHNYYFPTNIL